MYERVASIDFSILGADRRFVVDGLVNDPRVQPWTNLFAGVNGEPIERTVDVGLLLVESSQGLRYHPFRRDSLGWGLGTNAAHDLRVQIQRPVGLRKIVTLYACRNCAALASSLAASRADRMIEEPRWASASAMAAPMPDEAPVIKAVEFE